MIHAAVALLSLVMTACAGLVVRTGTQSASAQPGPEIQTGLHVFRCDAIPPLDQIKLNSSDLVSNTSIRVGQSVEYCAFRTSADGTSRAVAVQWELERGSEQGVMGIAPTNAHRVNLTGRRKGTVRL